MASADPPQQRAPAPLSWEGRIGAEHPRLHSKQGFGDPVVIQHSLAHTANSVLKPVAKQTT